MPWEGYALLGLVASLLLGWPRIAARIFERRLEAAGLGLPEATSDEDMLRHMSLLMSALGYRVERAAAEPEFDLILSDWGGHRRGLICRHFRRRVTVPLVEEAAKAAERLGMGFPIIVSVCGFTLPGRSAAQRTGVVAWDLTDLIMVIERFKDKAALLQEPPGASQAEEEMTGAAEPLALLRMAEPPSDGRAFLTQLPTDSALFTPKPHRRPARMRRGEKWESSETPHCPRCRRSMVLRNGTGGSYWGCSSFPRCLGTRPR